MPNIDDPQSSLTPREREVLSLAQEGRTNNEIAEALGITRNAVRFHLKDIHGKLETGGKRAALGQGWSRGLGLVSFPFIKLGVPTTIAVFAAGIVVTGYGAYSAFPSEGAPAGPKRFEGIVLIDGKYPNGCPAQFNAGTMTLADFAHGQTTMNQLRNLNPDIPDGPLAPEAVINVPYDPTASCGELKPTVAGAPKAFGTPPGK